MVDVDVDMNVHAQTNTTDPIRFQESYFNRTAAMIAACPAICAWMMAAPRRRFNDG